MTLLKLPKDITGDPRHDALLKYFEYDRALLWPGGQHLVPRWELTPALAQSLRHVITSGLAKQGLEQISQSLGNEQKGLDALVEKNAELGAQAPRISRVLLLADDGSERFYRECDSLLTRFAKRLVAIRFPVTGEALGQAVSGAPKLMRALLVADKKAVARVLLSAVPPA